MNAGVDYKLFYEILLGLREDFHSYGRIDDSNMKLDEIVKLIMLSYYQATKGKRFSLKVVKEYAKTHQNDESAVATALRGMFEEATHFSLYRNTDGTSIFGANPSLNIQPSENLFAERIISEIEKIDFVNLIEDSRVANFDILNECFGHFVRENFRNNKEDAQYMTPAEIAGPILSIVFNDFVKEKYFERIDLKSFVIMDPTCGVGTLLVEAARKYIDYLHSINAICEEVVPAFLKESVVGQDKVDRMVRLSKINTLLLGGNSQNIFIGNSISTDSTIDAYKNGVDFIFTNPPFGAEYNCSELNTDNFDLLDQLDYSGNTICSEILMLLKCLHLLKPHGKLAIVLPDSVFSAKGLNAEVRDYILTNYTINGIFEMPPVTFAQAGTRTKTSILYLTKECPAPNHRIVMGICNDIGYIVKERSGVPVKVEKGKNQMANIALSYIAGFGTESIVSVEPSVTAISKEELIDGILTPNFYGADRIQMLRFLENKCIDGYELRALSDIVRFETIGRKNRNVSNTVRHISVLHINADSTIDFQQVEAFIPVSKGRQCKEGDILFSKINPRIPRMTVVPKYDKELVCSNEFEILRPIADIGAHVICLLLKTTYVAKQIENLTSGTSSSHCRIKREQLSDIKIPYPTSEEAKKLFSRIDKETSNAFSQKYAADNILLDQLNLIENII